MTEQENKPQIQTLTKPQMKGREILRNPVLNKGTAFTKDEREVLGLHGLLPAHVSTIEEQLTRRYENFSSQSSRLDKYVFLSNLQNRNETLFYRLINDHVDEMLPYIYTPAVGDASLDFSNLYTQSRGVYISYQMEDKIEEILLQNKLDDADVIVVTDGGRVLGLGDVGVGGMVIPIGKSALYSLFAGIAPSKTLPVFLDVGCDTARITENPLYIGVRQKRLPHDRYYKFIDKFVAAVKKVYPNTMLQWEDFPREHANVLLDKYKETICSFNDDIQGTASVALAGILSALKKKEEGIATQKIAILGAGSAGLGIARILVRYMETQGISSEEARKKIFLIDRNGLVQNSSSHIRPEQEPFAHDSNEVSFWSTGEGSIDLASVVENAQITILIGVSTKKGAFDKNIITKLLANTDRPIVFPLSNPNSKSEILPSDLYKWSHGKAITATGSPYSPVEYEGKEYKIEQCNNVYIFPSIGLAASALGFTEITEDMFVIAAESLSGRALPFIFPTFPELKKTTIEVAEVVCQYAINKGLVKQPENGTIREALEKVMWHPKYRDFSQD